MSQSLSRILIHLTFSFPRALPWALEWQAFSLPEAPQGVLFLSRGRSP